MSTNKHAFGMNMKNKLSNNNYQLQSMTYYYHLEPCTLTGLQHLAPTYTQAATGSYVPPVRVLSPQDGETVSFTAF